MIKSDSDYFTHCYNVLLLYGGLYTLTRIALENENNKFLDSRETDTSAHNTDLGDNLNYTFQCDYSDYYAHRLYKVGGRYYGYDANGNMWFICWWWSLEKLYHWLFS